VLNRKGRARLLACVNCGELVRCERCGAAVQELEPGVLRCQRCGAERPLVCGACGATKLKVVRAGVSRVRDELERLAGRPVGEVTGDSAPGAALEAPVVVGTEAAVHADPSLFAVVESARRAALRFPPEAALALVSGAGADDFVDALGTAVEVMGPADGRWLVRAPDHRVLCDALAAVPRPAGRLRIAVDPLRA